MESVSVRVFTTGHPRKSKTAEPFWDRPFKDASRPRRRSGLLGFEDLPAAIHAGLQIHVVRTAQLARILVLDIGGGAQRIGRTTKAALHWRGLALWHCHQCTP